MTASVFFLPDLLVRIACQLVAGRLSGFEIEFKGFGRELGGELEGVSGDSGWSRIFAATVFGPLVLGAALLLPFLIGSSLLGVSVLPSVDANRDIFLAHTTSLIPFVDTLNRFGRLQLYRLWFGIACFYCCVPSAPTLEGAREELKSRRLWSPLRLIGIPILNFFRLLRAVDFLLTFGFAGAHLASGVLVLVISWEA
jgi:hypothetical protein